MRIKTKDVPGNDKNPGLDMFEEEDNRVLYETEIINDKMLTHHG